MTEPNTSPDLQDCPKIRIGGKDWPVPLFAPRQNRKIIPGLMRLRGLKDSPDLSEEQYDDLLGLVYLALTRAHPSLKLEEMMDWPIPGYELMAAFPIIALQTGMVKSKAPGEAVKPGEAQSLPTGTESLPTS